MARLALIAGLLLSNFKGAETKIEYRIERLHSLDDPRFTNELGVLLGPPFLKGNKNSTRVAGASDTREAWRMDRIHDRHATLN